MIAKNTLDLERHLCITSAQALSAITKPLATAFGIKHFRYLKLYRDGSRILLSNHPDCIRFMYGAGHYKDMWFDGEFPDCLSDGWHIWDALRTVSCANQISPLEKEINQLLGLYHGLTLVNAGVDFHEIYTFDSNCSAIYQINKDLFLRFIFYFKEQAHNLLVKSDEERLVLPIENKALSGGVETIGKIDEVAAFLNATGISRYYLSGKYSQVYLTEKEMRCVFWLIRGKTAEEIANIEGNTKRTVQFHFENIRTKLGCYKQTQIIPIILESGILNAIFNLNGGITK